MENNLNGSVDKISNKNDIVNQIPEDEKKIQSLIQNCINTLSELLLRPTLSAVDGKTDSWGENCHCVSHQIQKEIIELRILRKKRISNINVNPVDFIWIDSVGYRLRKNK